MTTKDLRREILVEQLTSAATAEKLKKFLSTLFPKIKFTVKFNNDLNNNRQSAIATFENNQVASLVIPVLDGFAFQGRNLVAKLYPIIRKGRAPFQIVEDRRVITKITEEDDDDYLLESIGSESYKEFGYFMEKSASIPIQSPKQHFPILSSPTIFPIQNCQTPKLSTTDFLARPVDKKPSSLNTLSLLSLGIRSADSSPNSSATLSSGGSESPVSIVEMERPAKGWNLTSEFSNVCLEFGNVVR